MPSCRHAIGASMLEEFAAQRHLAWRLHPTLGAYIAEHQAAKHRTILVYPLVQYNISGAVVLAAARRFGVASDDITVLHDDLDVKLGSVKWKRSGSAGGNGVKSCVAALGTDSFRRLRIGIGRPVSKEPSAIVPFVLSSMPEADRAAVREACSRATVALHLFDLEMSSTTAPAPAPTPTSVSAPTAAHAVTAAQLPATREGLVRSAFRLLFAYASTMRVAVKWLAGCYQPNRTTSRVL